MNNVLPKVLFKCHVHTCAVMIVISLKIIIVAFSLVNVVLCMVPVYGITRITGVMIQLFVDLISNGASVH